jgi:hypothetical protein
MSASMGEISRFQCKTYSCVRPLNRKRHVSARSVDCESIHLGVLIRTSTVVAIPLASANISTTLIKQGLDKPNRSSTLGAIASLEDMSC